MQYAVITSVDALRYGGGIEVLVMLGLLLSTGVLLGVAVAPALLVAGACGAWLAYVAERAWRVPSEDEHNHPARVRWVRQNRGAVVVGVLVAILAGLGTAWWLSPKVWGLGLALGGVSAAYVTLGRRWRRSAVGLAKPVAIAAVWAAAGVLGPVLAVESVTADAAYSGVLVVGAYRFFFLLANTLLADARDARGDAAEGLETPATRFGAVAIRRTALGCALLALGLAAALAVHGESTPLAFVALDGVGVAALGILASQKEPPAAWQIDLLAAWPLAVVLLWKLAALLR